MHGTFVKHDSHEHTAGYGSFAGYTSNRRNHALPFCGKVHDHHEHLFLIVIQRVNQRAQCREIVRPEQGATRRYPLEVVNRTPIGPRRRNTPQRLRIHLAAHHGNKADIQVGMNAEGPTQPRMEGVGYLNNIMRM